MAVSTGETATGTERTTGRKRALRTCSDGTPVLVEPARARRLGHLEPLATDVVRRQAVALLGQERKASRRRLRRAAVRPVSGAPLARSRRPSGGTGRCGRWGRPRREAPRRHPLPGLERRDGGRVGSTRDASRRPMPAGRGSPPGGVGGEAGPGGSSDGPAGRVMAAPEDAGPSGGGAPHGPVGPGPTGRGGPPGPVPAWGGNAPWARPHRRGARGDGRARDGTRRPRSRARRRPRPRGRPSGQGARPPERWAADPRAPRVGASGRPRAASRGPEGDPGTGAAGPDIGGRGGDGLRGGGSRARRRRWRRATGSRGIASPRTASIGPIIRPPSAGQASWRAARARRGRR